MNNRQIILDKIKTFKDNEKLTTNDIKLDLITGELSFGKVTTLIERQILMNNLLDQIEDLIEN